MPFIPDGKTQEMQLKRHPHLWFWMRMYIQKSRIRIGWTSSGTSKSINNYKEHSSPKYLIIAGFWEQILIKSNLP